MNFSQLLSSMQGGVVVTDERLRVLYLNDFARSNVFSAVGDQPVEGLMLGQRFLTTGRTVFDMAGCMQSMPEAGERSFHKTLIIQQQDTERLLYVTGNALRQNGQHLFLFLFSDITDEMDCITHSPGSFGARDLLIGQRIIGHDSKIRDIYRLISLAADSMVNVMITGESGTGKELVADAIHHLSDRRNKPLVKVNCSALSETLLESELFGHVKGAFTGAVKDRPGKIEEAQGGTLFLDEIGEISPGLQVKLLRVIQEKTIERVGGNRPVRVDMRIICATNRNLQQLTAGGQFREDLFYRLNVFPIHMPPLRERMLDIPLLCDHFIGRFNQSTGKQVKGISREAMRLLMNHPWPGNIRELQNAMEYAFVLVDGQVIETPDLPVSVNATHDMPTTWGTAMPTTGGTAMPTTGRTAMPATGASVMPTTGASAMPDTGGFAMPSSGAVPDFATSRQHGMPSTDPSTHRQYHRPKPPGGRLPISREKLVEALELNNWNQTKTATYLGISRVALWRKMKKMGL